MAASDPAPGPDESLPWSLLPEPPGLTALESAMRDLDQAIQPSTPIARVGVEGTGSYGAGLARRLAAAGTEVVEVNRPNRQTRRRRGKTDIVDAEAAARAALSREATAVPKAADGHVEAIRMWRDSWCCAYPKTATSNSTTSCHALSPLGLLPPCL